MGLSPLDVDDVVLTIRAFPIRVAGNSGPFDLEISWDYITTEGKHKYSIQETTSVTKLVRRVAKFSPSIVQKAILANQPTKIVLNHIDYLCSSTADNYAEIINKFINKVETSINRNIDYLGFGPEFLKKNIKKMSTEKPPNKDVNTYVKNKNDAGMFSATQIAYYIENYGIIQNYDKACYGSASYHMRIGGEVLTWDGGVKTEFTLDQDEDRNKNKYTNVELKPNSLTFVTTIEKFNLPKDIICRFNLKSKWVHQGLLLGTGPIVDPQLNAYLLIPLHNFSSKTIRINYADELISVEFTKTLNPDEAYSSPDGSVYKFIENPNWHYDFKGYRKRIENKIIESSVLSTFHSLKSDFKSYKDSIDSQIKETENITKELSLKSEKELDRFRTINWVGLIGTILGVTVLVFTTWQLIENAHEKVDSAHNLVKQYDKQGVDFSTFALKSSIEEIQHEFQELKKYTERMNTESYINSSKVTVDIENLKKSVNDRITSLEKHIEAQ